MLIFSTHYISAIYCTKKMSFLSLLPTQLETLVTRLYFSTRTYISPPRTFTTTQNLAAMNVHIVPALEDNYSYILECAKTKKCAAIDPVDARRVYDVIKQHELDVGMVLCTHHHWDHSGGNNEFAKLVLSDTGRAIDVYGADGRVQGITKKVGHDETFRVGELKVTTIVTPGHTKGHACYLVSDAAQSPDAHEDVVFTGDTLFVAGCGKFFEGTPKDMYESLKMLAKLHPSTRVYCGHEYTRSNLRFAAHVEPDNQDIQNKLQWSQEHACTMPSSIGEELKINPFMRVHEKEVQEKMGMTDPVQVLGALREAKNRFR